MKLSIIIPIWKEPLAQKTISDILEKSELGDQMEVIAVLDGERVDIIEDKRVKVIFLEKNIGMRGAINAGITASSGEFIMKTDAHCMFAKGFDKVMVENCKENWLMIPRRYSLEDSTWTIKKSGVCVDYHYLSFPNMGDPPVNEYDFTMQVVAWNNRQRNDVKYDIDNTMMFQGSCWLANREYFLETVGMLNDSDDAYGSFAQEQEEIGLNYWLKGGEVIIIKKTWYAHLSKRSHHYNTGKYDRRYKKHSLVIKQHKWSTKHWMNNEEPGCIHSLEWVIEKFMPIPGWPQNWEQVWENNRLKF